jgi:hypothetical protein
MTISITAAFARHLKLTGAAAMLVCLFIGHSTAPAADPLAPPDGWWVYKTGELSDADRECVAHAWVNRFAQVSNGTLQLNSGPAILPGPLNVPYAGGRLAGVNLGEWGGKLEWAASNGSTRATILAENVLSLVHAPFGNFLLTGSPGWLGDGDGAIWRLSDESVIPPTATHIANVQGMPGASFLSPHGSIVIVTPAQLVRVPSPGSMQTILSVDFRGLFPSSIVEMPDGVIYIGMRHFLVRLVPAAGSYRLDWLLPADCPRFKPADHDCVCSASEP